MQFGTGNRQTLFEQPKAAGRDVRDALIDLHKKVGLTPVCIARVVSL
jgi:secreted Zn-dependent insulinase-like peptidase